MADRSFLDRRGHAGFAAAGGSPSSVSSAAGGVPEACAAAARGGPSGAGAGGQAGAAAAPFAPAAAAAEADASSLRRLSRCVRRSAVAWLCCCGVGSRLLRRLLWVPSSLFLPPEAQAVDEDQTLREADEDDMAYGLSMPYRSAGVFAASSAAAAARARAAAAEKIWKSYFFGQLANVAKAAVWWSTFGVLILALAGPAATGTAVGLTRAAFNLALVLASPVAGAFVERRSIRALLATTTSTRLLIWSFAVPAAAWFALSSSSTFLSTSLDDAALRVARGGGPLSQRLWWAAPPGPPPRLQQEQEPQQLYQAQWDSKGERDASVDAQQLANGPPRQRFAERHPRQQQQQSSRGGPHARHEGEEDGDAAVSGRAFTSSVSQTAERKIRDERRSSSSSSNDSRKRESSSKEGSHGNSSSSDEDGDSSDTGASGDQRRFTKQKSVEDGDRKVVGTKTETALSAGGTERQNEEDTEEISVVVRGEAGTAGFADFVQAEEEPAAAGERAAAEEGREVPIAGARRAALDEELRAAAREERSWLQAVTGWLREETEEVATARMKAQIATEAEAPLRGQDTWSHGVEAAGGRGRQGGGRELYEVEQTAVFSRRLAADGHAGEAVAAASVHRRLPEAAVAAAADIPASAGAPEHRRDPLTRAKAPFSAAANGAQAAETDGRSSAAVGQHSADTTEASAATGAAASSAAARASLEHAGAASLSSKAASAPLPPSAAALAHAAAASHSASFAPPAVSVAAPPDAYVSSVSSSTSPRAPSLPGSAAAPVPLPVSSLSPTTAAAPGIPPAPASPAAGGSIPTAATERAFPSWMSPLGSYVWTGERRSLREVAAAATHATAASAAAATQAAGAAVAAAAAPAWRWMSAQAEWVGRGLTQAQLLWVLVALMFVDGLQVAFANAVDIDCGGLETLGLQYDLPLSEELRTSLNTRHQFVFDFSFIFFTPPVACLVCLVSRLMHAHVFSPGSAHQPLEQQKLLRPAQSQSAAFTTEYSPLRAAAGHVSHVESSSGSSAAAAAIAEAPNGRVREVLPLLLCMSVVFGGLSLLSLLFYCCGLPRRTVLEEQRQQEEQRAAAGGAAGREQRVGHCEDEEEEQQQKLQRQQQRWDFFGSPVNNAAGGAGAVGATGGGWEGSSGSDACDDNSDLRSAFSSSSVQTVSVFQETVARLEDLREGLAIVLREKALGWRLIFLALETALEDSMVSVVVPQIALTHFSSNSYSSSGVSSSDGYSDGYSNGSNSAVVGRAAGGAGDATGFRSEASAGGVVPYGPTSVGISGENSSWASIDDWVDWLGGRVSAANLFAACVIAVGKVGGCLAGIYMNRHWVPPASRSRGSSYKWLFWSVFGSSVAVLLLPLSRLLLLRQLVPQWGAVALVLLSTFCFFLFSTAPKIGFAGLLQGLVSSQIVACKVFGFVGTFVTLVDACVIAAVNLLFSLFPQPDALHALGAVSVVYFLHGIVEALLGPLVILEPHPSSSDVLLIQRQRTNSTLDGRVSELAASPFGPAAEGRGVLRPMTHAPGTEADDFDGAASCTWGAAAADAESTRGWSPSAGSGASRASLPNSAAIAATGLPRKGRKSQENLPPEVAFAVGNRKSNTSRLPCTGNTTHVDMR